MHTQRRYATCLGSVPEKDGGQTWQGGAGQTRGSIEPPPLKPVQVHFGGKAVLILLMAVWYVSMYEDGGNRPPQAI